MFFQTLVTTWGFKHTHQRTQDEFNPVLKVAGNDVSKHESNSLVNEQSSQINGSEVLNSIVTFDLGLCRIMCRIYSETVQL